jgi:acetyl-CoA acetyltransferase
MPYAVAVSTAEAVCPHRFGSWDGRAGHNPQFAGAEERSVQGTDGAASWEPSPGLPDIYIASKRAGMTIDHVHLVEVNEAFAAQVIPSARHLGISWDNLNLHGGAIALGHPFGMSGSRIMTTLLKALQTRDKTIGLESMCVGGGQGMAMVIERLS